MSACAGGCGVALPPQGRGQPRKWCSDRCRKQTLYSRPCIDCGRALNGSDGLTNGPTRCIPCTNVVNGAARTVWTREACIEAILWWADEYGEHPSQSDWWSADPALLHGDRDRARRYERAHSEGKIPHARTIMRTFGSWNAAIAAAGFEPRSAHGGNGNQIRRRSAA